MLRAGMATAVIAAAAVGSACTPTEQQYIIELVNSSEETLIVQLEAWNDPVRLEPGESGVASAFGRLSGPLVVMDTSCEVLESIDVTAQAAKVYLHTDRASVFEAVDARAPGLLVERTSECSEPIE